MIKQIAIILAAGFITVSSHVDSGVYIVKDLAVSMNHKVCIENMRKECKMKGRSYISKYKFVDDCYEASNKHFDGWFCSTECKSECR